MDDARNAPLADYKRWLIELMYGPSINEFIRPRWVPFDRSHHAAPINWSHAPAGPLDSLAALDAWIWRRDDRITEIHTSYRRRSRSRTKRRNRR
jgi:hypothetical protein